MRAALPALVAAAALAPTRAGAVKPHILMVMADDLGWADVNFHRKESHVSDPAELSTPALDQLVKEGVELERVYVYSCCSPTRSSFISGRYPIHVNDGNQEPTIYNEETGTGAGIPRNMTCIGNKMKEAGYQTHMIGKWDAGMATPDHTPHGRGFDRVMAYFHHSNGLWGSGSPCAGCTEDKVSCWDLYGETAPLYQFNYSHLDCQRNNSIPGCVFEEAIFHDRAAGAISNYTAGDKPLFIYYASRVAHFTYDVPQLYLDRFPAVADNPQRQLYHAMVSYLDESVGNLTQLARASGVWDTMLVWFASDNGGPIYGVAGATNYPLRGGKYSNFDGGVRSAAFVSGGFLPAARRGQKETGLMHIVDYFATFCDLGGVGLDDARSTAAGLPPIDGVSMWPLISGATKASPRPHLPLGVNIRRAGAPEPQEPPFLYELADGTLTPRETDMYPAYSAAPPPAPPRLLLPALAPPAQCPGTQTNQDYADANLTVLRGVDAAACCHACGNDTRCAVAVLLAQQKERGDCALKSSALSPIAQTHSRFPDNYHCVAYFPSAKPQPPPPPAYSGPSAAVIVGRHKLIVGQVNFAWWSGPVSPNKTTPYSRLDIDPVHRTYCGDLGTPTRNATVGCLYDIYADEGEHNDLAGAMPDKVDEMLEVLLDYGDSRLHIDRGNDQPAACKQLKANGNFWGPWLP